MTFELGSEGKLTSSGMKSISSDAEIRGNNQDFKARLALMPCKHIAPPLYDEEIRKLQLLICRTHKNREHSILRYPS